MFRIALKTLAESRWDQPKQHAVMALPVNTESAKVYFPVENRSLIDRLGLEVLDDV